ncbi:hypothetical protein BH09MYX1_BH09MYX1_30060 [soil metagenome]
MRKHALVAVVAIVALSACKKDNDNKNEAPIVKATTSECAKLMARLAAPTCKSPPVDSTELDVAQTMGMASLDGDPNLKDAHETNCKASNASLDKYKECAATP